MSEPGGRQPSRRDRTRPAELLGLSAVLAVFTGVAVFIGTRELTVAAIFAGIVFIVSLVVLAMLLLAVTPGKDDEDPGAGGH